MKPILTATTIFTISLLMTGCLKTRTAVRGDEDERSTPVISGAKSSDIELMKNEITRLTGRVDDLDHQTRQAGEKNEVTNKLDGRISELEKNQLLIMSELKELKDKAGIRSRTQPQEEETEEEKPKSSGNLLKAGFDALAAKDYETAADSFRGYLDTKPSKKDAAEAHFGIGEAEFGQRNYKKAIVEYSKVQELNPKSARGPESLLKIATCFEKLNMQKEARSFYDELIEKFPKSTQAKKARAKAKN